MKVAVVMVKGTDSVTVLEIQDITDADRKVRQCVSITYSLCTEVNVMCIFTGRGKLVYTVEFVRDKQLCSETITVILTYTQEFSDHL